MKIPPCNAQHSFIILIVLLLSTFSWADHSHGEFIKCLTRISPFPSSISKVIYTPNNSSYTSVLDLTINNLRFETPTTPKPLAIVTPMDESQIQRVIYCAKKHGIQMRIRSGGHDYEGLSYVAHVPFVLLDMINLQSVNVDVKSKTAWVQAGATLGKLYYSIAQKSKTLGFPAGVWSTVGAGGLISGGGYGTLRRKYGLAADNVIDAILVDVNGRILDRKSMGEDLFWAIRGGGGSSFGVIVSWKLKLVPVPEIVTVFEVDKTLEQNATDIMYKWQTVAYNLPRDVEIRIVANTIFTDEPNESSKTVLDTDGSTSTTINSGKTVRLRFVSLYLGRADKVVSMMQKIFPELGLVRADCVEVSYIQSVLLFSLFPADAPLEGLLNRTSFRIPFKGKSGFVDKPIPKEGLEGIWDRLMETEPLSTNMIFTSYGGKMAEISESAIPFPHRAGTLYKMYMRVSMDKDQAKALNWIRGLYKYLGPYSTKNPRTAYYNYDDLDLGKNNLKGPISYERASKWGKKYFKNNFDRLVQVKSMVDPGNFFRHEQSIPPL